MRQLDMVLSKLSDIRETLNSQAWRFKDAKFTQQCIIIIQKHINGVDGYLKEMAANLLEDIQDLEFDVKKKIRNRKKKCITMTLDLEEGDVLNKAIDSLYKIVAKYTGNNMVEMGKILGVTDRTVFNKKGIWND